MRALKPNLSVQALRQIPAELLPESLRTMVFLPRVSRIAIQYQRQPRQFHRLFHFIKKFCPSIRYYNPTIEITRKMDAEFPPVPVIKIFVKENQEQKLLAQLVSSNFETEQQILEGIIKAVNVEEEPRRME